MNYRLSDYYLEFLHPFSIAHGTRNGTSIVLLELTHQDLSAFGEASLPPYLKETTESVKDFITGFFSAYHESEIFSELKITTGLIKNFGTGNMAARACLDIAFHNWFAKKRRVHVYELLHLSNSPVPDCMFTIGMSDEEELKQKLDEAADFRILKIKLGGGRDEEIIRTLRKFTDKPICVDVNQGWRTREEAKQMMDLLMDNNCLLIEQPFPVSSVEDQQWLFHYSPVPLYADESVQVAEDVYSLKEYFHGINIKLMKCGGITGAMEMIKAAQELNMKVMIGSMSETGCGIMAAAQLSSMAEFVDLDGPLLTKNNPFPEVNYQNGKLVY
jgi:L-Ala-D/L-Glu epimerase